MSGTTLRGGCLCGAVQYETRVEPARFYHCHCKRCRKATGTGHATNLFIKSNVIDWLSGEEQINRYKIPESARFTRTFCKQCGSPLPRVIPELGVVMIPAGSLDSEPGMTPQARIFWDSRADWSCSADELPVFTEYPPEKGK